MKLIGKWLLLIIFCQLSACQSAYLPFPGGKIHGTETHADSFSFANKFTLLQLEVRPENPYSIWLRVVMRGDQLYIDAAEHRKWHGYLDNNKNVRIKLGNKIYPAKAVQVTDPKLLSTFIKGRSIYRIDPADL